MTFHKHFIFLFFAFFSLSASSAFATVDGALSGTVSDDKGIAVPNAKIIIKGQGVEKTVISTTTGAYQVFPLTFGEYQVSVEAEGFNLYQGTVEISGNTSNLDVSWFHRRAGKWK